MTTAKSSKRWKCPKCGRQYIAALPATAILCRPCTNQIGKPEQWMNPDNETPTHPGPATT